ncbi:MAG: protoglobin family protein [Planctomycetia bacterium]|nr:protoglobin family protein [Planctomycetia bacterium]
MKQIDEARLETEVAYRVEYVSEFMGFDGDDIAAIHGAAAVLAPVVPSLVKSVYEKLFSYDATKRHFVPRQSGYEGPVPDSLESLGQDHEMIQFRKQHLARYLVALVTRPYDGKMIGYLDLVGKMHTPKAGSPELDVPLVQMNALMGFVADALTTTIFDLGLDRESEVRTVRAFNKLLWLQSDLTTRHYQEVGELEAAGVRANGPEEDE